MIRPDLDTLGEQIRHLTQQELGVRINGCARQLKDDGSLLTELDLALNQRIHAMLDGLSADIAFLSEEMPLAEQQITVQSGQAYWCLDPLDGTSNFVGGIPFFCTSLALVDNGYPQLAIVYDPVRDELFSAGKGQGAWLNGQPLSAHPVDLSITNCIGLIDLKRLPRRLLMALIEQRPFSSQRNFGACALEWSWLAAGRGHLLLHGGQKLWDHAAGFLILMEAGGQAQTLEGQPVFNSTLDPRSVVAALDPAIFDQWRTWVSRFTSPGPR